MADAHSGMLELSVALATREAAGEALSPAQRAVAEITWIGTQVSPNGFDGWLYYTNCDRMRGTLNALEEVGLSEVAALVREALAIAAIDPGRMSDEERESAVDRMTEEDRATLGSGGLAFLRRVRALDGTSPGFRARERRRMRLCGRPTRACS